MRIDSKALGLRDGGHATGGSLGAGYGARTAASPAATGTYGDEARDDLHPITGLIVGVALSLLFWALLALWLW